jgi:hypothetical protein
VKTTSEKKPEKRLEVQTDVARLVMLIKKTNQGDKSAADTPEQRKKTIDLT